MTMAVVSDMWAMMVVVVSDTQVVVAATAAGIVCKYISYHSGSGITSFDS